MKVAIRVDASLDLGIGHVMRCMTFANTMSRRGAAVTFLCQRNAGHLCDLIEESGFALGALRPHAGSWRHDAEESLDVLGRMEFRPDLLVVDHYDLDSRWEQALRPVARRILVIDDLANRAHDCEVLVDPNLHDAPASRYAGLVAENTRVFVGPQYAFLRPEFEYAIPHIRDRGVRKILVFFGGSDPSNETLKVVHALRELAGRAPKAVVVLGPIHPQSQQIRHAALGLADTEIIGATAQMARLMMESDLALGTCGGSAWERCVLGLPALVVVSAENQRDDARILHALGAVRNLGDAHAAGVDLWVAAIAAIQGDSGALSAMSRAARAVMQGREAAVHDFETSLVH